MSAEAELLEEITGLPGEEVEYLRQKCREDLFFLAKGVLGHKDVNKDTHGAFCRFIQTAPVVDGERILRRLGLMPRAHLKTTLGSEDDSVRLALADPGECRILIASETAKLAEKILDAVKGHFEKNKVLRELFPELIPKKFSGPGVTWNSQAATINRDSVHKDPTWSAIGVGGAVTGGHFTRIKCDDLIGFEALRSPAKMAEAKAWVDYIEPLVTNSNTDIIEFWGTRWAKNDLYAYIMGRYKALMAVFSRRAIEGGQIIFPALHNWTEYEQKQRESPALWHAQYENNPLSSVAKDLPDELLRFFRFSSDGERLLFVGPDGRPKSWDWRELDRVCTIDPNGGSKTAEDLAAISIQAQSPDDEIFQLHIESDRYSPSGLVDRAFALCKRWQVTRAGSEKAGQQNTHFYLRQKIREDGYFLRVEELSPGKLSKPDRIISVMEPLLRSERYYVLESQSTLRQQIGDCPDLILWDELDAAAYGPKMLRKPSLKTKKTTKQRQAIINQFMKHRSSRTGYGR